MAFTFAGQYGPELLTDTIGRPYLSTAFTVVLTGTATPATLWTDRTKTTTMPNPGLTTSAGNARFFCDPGLYDLMVAGVTVATGLDVLPDRLEPVAAVAAGSVTDASVAVGAAISQSKVATLVSDLAAKAGTAAPVFSGDVNVIASRNNPTGLLCQNLSAGTSAMSGIRAVRPDGNAVWIGAAGPTTTALGGVGVNANEAGLWSDGGLPGLKVENTTPGGYILFQKSAVEVARFDANGHFTPGQDITYNLGSLTKRWLGLWATQGLIGGAQSPAEYALAVKGAPGQSVAPLQVKDSTGATVVQFTVAGRVLSSMLRGLSDSGPYIAFGSRLTLINPDFYSSATTDPSCQIFGQTGQTADLCQFRVTAATIDSRVGPAGRYITKVATAPVLADLVDGEIAFHTDGAGALKVSARVAGVLTTKTATLT